VIKKTPMPFQFFGAKHLASGFHKTLCDVPGLGKTIQAILAAMMVGAKTVLVACPASVRLNWFQEFEECVGHTRGLDVISYNGASLPKVRERLRDKYDVFIPDEFHFLKNMESQRTGAIFSDSRGLARRASYIWPLSGTPVLNRPRELHVILRCLAAKKIHPYVDFDMFAQKFCAAYYDGMGINTKGASNLDELSMRIMGGPSPFMLRRTKAEVFPELPQRIVRRMPIEVSPADWRLVLEVEKGIVDREAYISAASRFQENFSQLGDNARLRRATGTAKVRAVAAFTDDLLETVEKISVFTWHHDVTDGLVAEFAQRGLGVSVYPSGGSDKAKKASTMRFREDPNCRVFIGNMLSAGTGINDLQYVCNDVVFAEVDWVPGIMGQAIDRVDRMDKKFKEPVNAYIPYIPGSLESAMLGSGDGKTRVINRLVDSDHGSMSWLTAPQLGMDFSSFLGDLV